MEQTDMKKLGITSEMENKAMEYTGMKPARIASQNHDIYKVINEEGVFSAKVSGKFRYESEYLSQYPVVGDFIMLEMQGDGTGEAVIKSILPRKSVFSRKVAGKRMDTQVLAANIDMAFLCMSLNQDFNLRRMERYLTTAWESGAIPVVVLTKSDLCEDVDAKRAEVESIAFGVDILVVSDRTEGGYAMIDTMIESGTTMVFLGSSGVGKSTIINYLMHEDIMATKEVRSDDRGKHATTHRELFVLPNGGIVIDTPGIREIGMVQGDLNRAFEDIELLAANCRFRDCRHENEPGCAVLAAVESGDLDAGRLESYRKISKELDYEGLDAKAIEKMKMEKMFKDFGGMKNARDFIKSKNRNR